MTPRPRALLVWRGGRNVFTREIGAASVAFVAALTAGQGAAHAAALTPDAAALIQTEILTASFCKILIGDPA